MRAVVVLLTGLTAGCGAGAHEASSSADTVANTHVTVEPAHVEREATGERWNATFKTIDGALISTGSQRGKPMLLHFFATFDGPSHANFEPLSNFTRSSPRVVVVAVCVQPNASQFATLWAETVNPPFLVAYPVSDVSISNVPVLIGLDRLGREVFRHVGIAESSDLRRAAKRLLR